ncbi:gamma-glutamylcyclotransferase [Deferribacter thermophilus]|uniref:gamma-glutamylcyclotransferase family protein n=1 Tax=Deferribacter thermophilus TaxID=53573 RepID=UPI003C1905E9
MVRDDYHKIFVYGTLMKGFEGFEKYMKDAEFIAEGCIKGSLYLTNSGYPIAVLDGKANNIKGEVYKVSEKTLNEIRRYEGTESALTYYTEKIVKVDVNNDFMYAHCFVAHPFFIPIIKMTCKNISRYDWKQMNNSLPFHIKYKRKIIFTLFLLINILLIIEYIIKR